MIGFNHALLEFLCCPRCRGDLAISASSNDGVDGQLTCQKCASVYQIRHGVPILLGNVNEADTVTGKNFAEQWGLFQSVGRLGPEFEERQVIEYFHPVDFTSMRGKRVLECGCGYGRNLTQVRNQGAAIAVGFDIGEAAFIAKRSGEDAVIGDILTPPFKDGVFDVVFSFGVLHHVSDPEAGAAALRKLVTSGGLFAHSVYSAENNWLLSKVLTPIRTTILSKLPVWLRVLISALFGVPTYIVFWILYMIPFSFVGATDRWASKNLFYYDFIKFQCRKMGLKFWIASVFDQLSAPVAYYISERQIVDLMARLDLQRQYRFFRNKNSWNFGGYAPSRN